MRRFFAEQQIEDRLTFDEAESKHLNRVLRLKVGEHIEVADGSGKLYEAAITVSHPKSSQAVIVSTIDQQEKEFGVHLAVAPTKNLSRWELFLEKATEIGIDRISPLLCDNSERRVLKRERQERILKSAVKQSHKLKIPALDELSPFKTFIENIDNKQPKYIAHCEDSSSKLALKKAHSNSGKALILIGPEGDFSSEEIRFAEANGFVSVSLSKSRLRTETAALVALHTLHLLND